MLHGLSIRELVTSYDSLLRFCSMADNPPESIRFWSERNLRWRPLYRKSATSKCAGFHDGVVNGRFFGCNACKYRCKLPVQLLAAERVTVTSVQRSEQVFTGYGGGLWCEPIKIVHKYQPFEAIDECA